MPIFLLTLRHTPENCPMFNEKAKKAYVEFFEKQGGLLKKHGIKTLGGWNVHTEHLSISVLEAPSLDVFNKFGMEPEVLALSAYETYEIRLVQSMEEAMKMLKAK
jgi:hypothetical protein